jgi:hypothetical protein
MHPAPKCSDRSKADDTLLAPGPATKMTRQKNRTFRKLVFNFAQTRIRQRSYNERNGAAHRKAAGDPNSFIGPVWDPLPPCRSSWMGGYDVSAQHWSPEPAASVMCSECGGYMVVTLVIPSMFSVDGDDTDRITYKCRNCGAVATRVSSTSKKSAQLRDSTS